MTLLAHWIFQNEGYRLLKIANIEANYMGGFQLEFSIISWHINCMTCYKFSALMVEITVFRLEGKSCEGFF